jgi:CHC2 zinc finger/Toprim-like
VGILAEFAAGTFKGAAIMRVDFSEIRATHSLAEFCRSRGMELRRNGPSGHFVCLCPFHSEKTPSFTVFPDNRARCFGCGWHGDVVDLELALAGGSLLSAAARIGGSGVIEPRSAAPKPAEKKIWLPDLEVPTENDLFRLSESRSIAVEPLRIAVERGFLWCFDDALNGRCWAYTDQSRRCAIRRRLDNQLFLLANGNETKAAACPGSDMKSPLGYHEAQSYHCIAVQEGGPNSLAAIAHAWASGVEGKVAPICMPSANSDFTPASLRYLQGKRVRIFTDNDACGKEAARRWAAQLRTAGVVVDGYSFEGLNQSDGSPVKDLNDLARVDADCWEQYHEVIESVMNFAFEEEN